MKKRIILAMCLSLALLCTGCNNKSDKNKSSIDDGYENIIDDECTSEYNTQDEMASYIISHKTDIFPLFFSHETQKANPDNLTFFSLESIPDGYELKNIKQCGEKITQTYENKTDGSAQLINFIWKFTGDGEVYIKNSVAMSRLTELSNLKNHYYTISKDENGTDFCEIEWAESGYAFELQGPTSWVDDTSLSIIINKTEYPLETK